MINQKFWTRKSENTEIFTLNVMKILRGEDFINSFRNLTYAENRQ
jgi:hypothetical protein